MDQLLIDFFKENFITLGTAFAILKVIFPNSRILRGIGDAVSERFPVFKKKE